MNAGADGRADGQRIAPPLPTFCACLRLPSSVQARVESGELSFRSCAYICWLSNMRRRLEKAAQGCRTFAFCSQTENYVQGLLRPERAVKKEPKPEPPVDPNVREVQSGCSAPRIEGPHRGSQWPRQGDYRVRPLEDFDTLLEQLAGTRRSWH